MQTNTNQNSSQIVVIVGAQAAGKDDLIQYLTDRYAVVVVEVGGFARQLVEEADKEKPPTYDSSAQQLAEHGPEYLIYRLVDEISQNEEWQGVPLVITGIRTPAETAVLKEQFGDHLLVAYIQADGQVDQVQERWRPTDTHEEQDESLKDESALAHTQEIADVTLLNHGSLDAFYEQIEARLVPHLRRESS